MTRADLVSEVSSRNHCTRALAADMLDDFLEVIAEAVMSGHTVNLRGFGTFCLKERSQRVGRNPRTGETVCIDKRYSPVFKPGKSFKGG